ncbi:MAG: hypothetical protein ABIS47_02890 [Acidimicrobiales bacterium]
MARGARLPVEVFEQGGGPAICVLSGQPTEHRIDLTATARATPTWLLFVGIAPYVVARLCAKRSRGTLPLTEEVEQLLASRTIKIRRIAIPCAVVVLVGVMTLFSLPGVGIILLIAPFSFMATIVLLNRMRSPLSPVHLDPAGRWVVIPHAAEEYASALDDQVETATPPELEP